MCFIHCNRGTSIPLGHFVGEQSRPEGSRWNTSHGELLRYSAAQATLRYRDTYWSRARSSFYVAEAQRPRVTRHMEPEPFRGETATRTRLLYLLSGLQRTGSVARNGETQGSKQSGRMVLSWDFRVLGTYSEYAAFLLRSSRGDFQVARLIIMIYFFLQWKILLRFVILLVLVIGMYNNDLLISAFEVYFDITIPNSCYMGSKQLWDLSMGFMYVHGSETTRSYRNSRIVCRPINTLSFVYRMNKK